MKIFTTYPQERGKCKINPGLLWEYRLDRFDLYGGIRGFRKIARDEVVDLSPRNLDFMCRALNIKKEDTDCYKRLQLRQAHLNS